MRLFLVAQPTACSLLAAAPAHDASFERDANEIPFSFQVPRPSVGRGRGRVLPSSLAFGECANSGMMPTGFISAAAAAAHRAKMGNLAGFWLRWRYALARSQLLARVEVLVGERTDRPRPTQRATEGFSCCQCQGPAGAVPNPKRLSRLS